MAEYSEYLIYIIIAVVYALGALKKAFTKEGDEQEDPDEEARARKIQETIRRRIQERKQQEQIEQEYPNPPVITEEVDTFEEEAAYDYEEAFTPEIDEPLPDYDQELQERLTQIEAAKQKLEAVKNLQKPQATYGKSTVKEKSGSLLSELRNASSLKKGFLYYEILGTPVSQRRNGSLKPSWEN